MIKTQYQKTESCNLLTLKQASKEFNMGTTTIEKLAKQCGAKLKIGYLARYRKDVLAEYINSFTVM